MADKKTTLTKKVVGRRRALADSDEDSSTEFEKELLLPANSTDFCKNCCSRNTRSFTKSKSHDKQSSSVDTHLNRSSYREQLEMKVLNEQVSLQVSTENWRELTGRLERLSEVSSVLHTLLSSVHVTASCLSKLNSMLFENNSELNDRCYELRDKIGESVDVLRNNEVSTPSSEETAEFNSKKSNLIKASNNFADILRRSSVPSNKQLSKLEKQYDDIRSQYMDAKSKATIVLNTRLQKKTESLDSNIQSILVPVITTVSELEKQMASWLSDASSDSIRKRLELTRSSSNSVGHVGSGLAVGSEARRRNCNCYDSSN